MTFDNFSQATIDRLLVKKSYWNVANLIDKSAGLCGIPLNNRSLQNVCRKQLVIVSVKNYQ